MINSFYDNLEPGVKETVHFLRDYGINTECSCEHEKYIQCNYNIDGSIKELDDLLFNAGFRNYDIEVHLLRQDGYILNKFLQINFEKLGIEDIKNSCLDFEKYNIRKINETN